MADFRTEAGSKEVLKKIMMAYQKDTGTTLMNLYWLNLGQFEHQISNDSNEL